ncbi:MAG: CPBP family intramembrane metalloprotease [Phycisphaerales bacterium]|nr:CPBP family intramembrane metalloprotease [Phycisphaerales bacterium]
MARSRSARGSAAGSSGAARAREDDWRGYGRLSTRPLHILCFLLPLIILYEVGTILYLTDHGRGVVETVSAQSILSRFFEVFGVASFYLPGIALATVLLLWHLLERDRWRIYPGVLAGMFCESLFWTLPLLVLGLLILPRHPAAAMATGDTLNSLSDGAKITLSVGAGLYEELLFRLIIIAGLHLLLVDVAGVKDSAGYIVAALVSSIAFALYHDLAAPGGGLNLPLAVFYALAGLYFAGLFVLRGFGIVVMVHTFYDVLVLVVIGSR